MQVSVLLQRKGSDVVTVAPHLTAAEAVDAMARHRVGAVVVTTDGATIDGILAERDVVLALSMFGPEALDRPTSARPSPVRSAVAGEDWMAVRPRLTDQIRVRLGSA